MSDDFLQANRIWDRVSTISFNAVEDHLRLLGSQEVVAPREVGYEVPCQDAEYDRKETLEEEDPLPAVETSAFEFLKELDRISQDCTEAAEDNGAQVKDSQAFLDFSTLVPGRNDEG